MATRNTSDKRLDEMVKTLLYSSRTLTVSEQYKIARAITELRMERNELRERVGGLYSYPVCDCKTTECLVLSGPIPEKVTREQIHNNALEVAFQAGRGHTPIRNAGELHSLLSRLWLPLPKGANNG